MRPSAGYRPLAVLLACGAVLLAGACGGPGDSDASGNKADEPKIELTIATFNEFGYEDLYREYESQHPNIKIVERRAPTVDAHIKNLETNLASGSGMADIEAMEVSWIYKYLAKADQFVDLREYGADDLKDRWLDWKVAGATTQDGKILGYGTDIGPEAICYRRDLFAKAGLPTDRAQVAKLFADWPSYFAAGRKFKAKVPGLGLVRLRGADLGSDAQPADPGLLLQPGPLPRRGEPAAEADLGPGGPAVARTGCPRGCRPGATAWTKAFRTDKPSRRWLARAGCSA